MFSQFKALRDEENHQWEAKNLKDGILTCWSELKHQKRKQNAIKRLRGARNRKPSCSFFLE